MGLRSKLVTSDNSDEESGDHFTDGDFGDSDEDKTVVERTADSKPSSVPVNESINKSKLEINGKSNGVHDNPSYSRQNSFNGLKNGGASNGLTNKDEVGIDLRRDSHGDQNPSIVGIIGDQHSHAEQRLAARRAARAEARDIRMRELERQQREQEDHADKAYDMYSSTKTEPATRRGGRLSALSPAGLHSPRRCSEDSEDTFSLKDLRHELKEVEEKFRKAMILNAQLDNDKAALGYQIELLKDRLEEQREDMAQLQREHKEKCSAHERLKREHVSVERELQAARDAVMARDAAAAAAGRAFVDATCDPRAGDSGDSGDSGDPGDHADPGLRGLAGPAVGSVPPLALVSRDSEQLLNEAGEGTLDVRLQKLIASKQSLESEVRKLKLTLNEERAARQNGITGPNHMDHENEVECMRRALAEAKARAARAEAEAALQGAARARLEAQAARLRARHADRDASDDLLKQERRKLQREAREALNRVEELETENSHLTKRLDKLKNAKSALLKEL